MGRSRRFGPLVVHSKLVRFTRSLLLGWLAVWLAAVLYADSPQVSATGPAALKNLSLEQLSQIQVTSPSKEPTPAFRSPVAIAVLTGEQIRRSGAKTIADALRLVPGVEVAQIDSSKWAVGIRGFGTRLARSVLVLIDGRTVYTPLFAGTYWEVQDTLLEDIDRIEVIRGPGGTIWGPNAVNGVINIITKTADKTQGTYASSGGGTHEQGFFNYRYGDITNNGIAWRAYSKGFTRGPEYHPDHDDSFDDWRGAQTGFRMDWTGGLSDNFTLQGDAYRQEVGERVNYTTYLPPFSGVVDGNAELSGANIQLKWKRTYSASHDFQLQLYYDRTNRFEPNLGETRNTVDLDLLEHVKAGGRHDLLFGIEGRLSPGHFHEVSSGLVFYPFHRTAYLVSGFFEDDITVAPNKLFLNLGTKLLRTNYAGFNAQPSARLLWTPTDRQTVWSAFTHAVRTPSDGEEDFYLSSLINYQNGLPVFARFNANQQFAPEQLNAYELGYRRLIGAKLYFDLAGFVNHYHNLFSEDITGPISLESTLPFPSPAPPAYYLLPAQFQNDLYGTTYGGEILADWQPTAFWRLRTSYSYLRMSLHQAATHNLSLGSAQFVGSSPVHEFNVESPLPLSKRFEIEPVLRYVSALTYQGVPGYTTADLRAALRFGGHFELAIAGRNLFQPHHLEYVGDPGGLAAAVGIRRSVYAELSWSAK